MNKERHHIDEYFKGLKDFETIAPEDSWKNIESQLNKKRRGGIISIWTGLAAGLALLIGLGGYLKYASQDQHSIHSSQSTSSFQHKSNDNISSINNNNLINPNSNKKQVIISEPEKGINSETTTNNKTSNANKLITINEENKLTQTENREISNNLTTKSNTNTQDENKTDAIGKISNVTGQSTEFKLSYLIPLGIDLKISTKPSLATQKESVATVDPLPETVFIFPADKDLEQKKISHWSILGQVAPVYSYRKSEQPTATVQGDEKGLMAYAGGIKVDYKTNRRLSIQTGVFYSVIGQTLDNLTPSNHASAYQSNLNAQSINMVYPSNNSMGPIVNKSNDSRSSDQLIVNSISGFDKPTEATSNITVTNVYATSQNTDQTATIIQELKFIEIPVLARYKIIDRKIGLHVLGGFSTNFLVNNNAILRQGSTTINNDLETGDINSINYSGTIGLGVNYEFLKRFDFSIEPTYKYYLNSISTNSQYNYRPYAFGIYTGIIYKFR